MSRVVRAAVHVHSEWSDDASWTLPRIAAAFRQRGYDVVMLSDHSRELVASQLDDYRGACEQASTDEILLVPGIEYNDPDNVVHVPVWGDVPFFGQQPDIGELLEAVSANDGISVLAHPWRRQAWSRYDPRWARHLTGIEVWNRKYDGLAPNRHALALAVEQGLRPFATVDFHTSRQFFPLAMRLELTGPRVDREAVHRALRAGQFQPEAFGRAASRYFDGLRLRGAEAVELARRGVRPAVSAVRRLRG